TTALVRYDADGVRDTTFGVDGFVYSGGMFLRALALDAAGNILVGGNVAATNPPNLADFAILRFLPDGRVDPTFGTAGVASVDVTRFDTIYDLEVLADGRIVATGQLEPYGTGQLGDFGMAR